MPGDGRLVHFAVGDAKPRPGDVIETVITYAAPHHLNADGVPLSHRRTRAGDAFEAGRRPKAQRGLARPADDRRPGAAAGDHRRLRSLIVLISGSERPIGRTCCFAGTPSSPEDW